MNKRLHPALPVIFSLVVIVPIISRNSFSKQPSYRDLNKNGKMDVYEDKSQPIEKRIDDLLAKMTIEEKAGMMFINGTAVNDDGTIEKKPGTGGFASRLPSVMEYIAGKKMNHFNWWQTPGTRAIATWYNNAQKYAEENSRLGYQ